MEKPDLQPQYIINEAGERTSVILPLTAFQELWKILRIWLLPRKDVMSQQFHMSRYWRN